MSALAKSSLESTGEKPCEFSDALLKCNRIIGVDKEEKKEYFVT